MSWVYILFPPTYFTKLQVLITWNLVIPRIHNRRTFKRVGNFLIPNNAQISAIVMDNITFANCLWDSNIHGSEYYIFWRVLYQKWAFRSLIGVMNKTGYIYVNIPYIYHSTVEEIYSPRQWCWLRSLHSSH